MHSLVTVASPFRPKFLLTKTEKINLFSSFMFPTFEPAITCKNVFSPKFRRVVECESSARLNFRILFHKSGRRSSETNFQLKIFLKVKNHQIPPCRSSGTRNADRTCCDMNKSSDKAGSDTAWCWCGHRHAVCKPSPTCTQHRRSKDI